MLSRAIWLCETQAQTTRCSMLGGSVQERGSLQKCNSGLATAARAELTAPGFAKAAFVVTQVASQSQFPNTKTSYLGLLRGAICLSSSHPEDLLVSQVLSRLRQRLCDFFKRATQITFLDFKQKVAITNFKQRAVQSLSARHSRFSRISSQI